MKRVSLSQTPKVKPNHKKQTKIKTKSKDKKFNPLEYLNSLIDQMHDHRFDTARKQTSSHTKKERKSALDYKTSVTDRTASCSKVRSKSSYSQYRKKSVAMRDIFRVDIDNAITEEDNIIRFTQETQNSIPQSLILSLSPYAVNLSRLAAARRIQRAWRNYQTLKVVRRYYLYYKNLMKREMQLNEAKIKQNSHKKKENVSEGRRQFQRTLKIRKDGDSSGLNNKTVRLNKNDIAKSLEFSSELVSQNTTKEMYHDHQTISLNQMQTVELQAGQKQHAELSPTSEVCTSRDLQFVIDLFRNSHELASRQINQKFSQMQCNHVNPLASVDSEQSSQSNLDESRHNQCSNQGISSAVFYQMQKVIKEKYILLRQQVENKKREKIIESDAARLKSEQLQGRMQRQLRQIRKCKQQYQKSTILLKQNMLKLQVNSSFVTKLNCQQNQKSTQRVRKCYSAETLILKSIIEEINLKNVDIQPRPSFNLRLPGLLQPNYPQQPKQQQRNLMFPTSPPSSNMRPYQLASISDSNHSLNCFQLSDHGRLLQQQIYNHSNFSQPLSQQKAFSQQINQFNDSSVELGKSEQLQMLIPSERQQQSASKSQQQNESLKIIKECSQQMQQAIELILMNEIVSQIYLNPKLYNGIKSFIEHPYEFKTISDYDIYHFISKELPIYYQPMETILIKFNQKINPDSIQILKLIRDFQFQIQQYELVLPEEVFKAYRRQIQEDYAQKIKQEQNAKIHNQQIDGFGTQIAQIVKEREREKKIKKIKFMSFQRDLKIMYMKSVFNCFNQYIIETKSFYTFMNSRSSIGPGELTLALKQYNWKCQLPECLGVMEQAKNRVMRLIHQKCMLPIFKNYKELQCFQKQITKQIAFELQQNQFKWVNYMDEVLQIWQDLSLLIVDTLLEEVTQELQQFF